MRYPVYALGVVFIGIGLTGLVRDGIAIGWALSFAAILLAHDLLLAPATLLVGTAVGRWAAPWRAAAIVAGTLVLATLPTVLAIGRRPDNPSILPWNYPPNLAVVLIAVAAVAAALHLKLRNTRVA
ncbi:hypothetical protein OIE66_06490 [Nonomuraea sp. NBC_01738]|uniref:hypothetical protein n=1 Tax=Nonomuraea sp. NBC_01738 TaxID=2976003 RepID=UPI002E13BB94|nr:hypothetical protein OIE66_06490 [Nonomuraea sp. NBC_01738]